jgi:hypothetical protein
MCSQRSVSSVFSRVKCLSCLVCSPLYGARHRASKSLSNTRNLEYKNYSFNWRWPDIGLWPADLLAACSVPTESTSDVVMFDGEGLSIALSTGSTSEKQKNMFKKSSETKSLYIVIYFYFLSLYLVTFYFTPCGHEYRKHESTSATTIKQEIRFLLLTNRLYYLRFDEKDLHFKKVKQTKVWLNF